MRILVASPVVPHPPSDGDRIRIYNFIRELSKKHKISLVCFARPGEEQSVRQMRKICKEVVTVPVTRAGIMAKAVLAVFSGRPLNTAAYESPKMSAELDAAIARFEPDVLYAYRLRMAPYIEDKKLPKVIDIVDSMALLNKRRLGYEKKPLRLIYSALDAGRILAYEKSLEKKFDRVFINSEEDAAYINIKNVTVVPNGSDGRRKRVKAGRQFTIGFFGNMEYPPNLDAALYLIKKVWKKLRVSDYNMRLAITGDKKGSLKRFEGNGITVAGYVADIDAAISGWGVSVVPVRYGAGRQNKIMKSWSCGVPVVSSEFAAKGVYGKDGQNMLIAKTPGEFAEKILAIKGSQSLAQKLAIGGMKTVRRNFDWKKSAGLIESAIRKAARKK